MLMRSICVALLALRTVLASQIPLVHERRLDKCLQEAGLHFETPDSPHFQEHRQGYQLRHDMQYQPAAIILPNSTRHISDAVQCAAKTGYKVAARGGGHSAIGASLGGQDGSVVVDMRRFDEVKYDKESDVAAIGAGVRQGPAYLALHKHGRMISGGVCPNIGLAGALSHGAYGLVHRKRGLGVDNVVAYDIVLANGTIQHVNQTLHPEIYWGLRGAASSFGIVTTFYVKTYDEPVTQIYAWTLAMSPEALGDHVQLLQKWYSSSNCVPEINSAAIAILDPLLPPGQLNVTFYLIGTDGINLTQLAAPLLEALPEPSIQMKEVPWIALASLYGMPLDLKDITQKAAHYEKSVILTKDWPEKSIRAVYDYIANHPRPEILQDPEGITEYRILFDLLGGYESQINKVSKETSSWAKRDAKYMLWVIANSKDSTYLSDASFDFVDGIYERMVGNLEEKDWGSYLNYADTRIDDYKLRYYGANYGRLSALKRRIDPTDLFDSPLGVKP